MVLQVLLLMVVLLVHIHIIGIQSLYKPKQLQPLNLSAGAYSVIVKDGVSSAITSVVVGKPSQLNLSTEINLSIDGGVAYFCEISNQQNEIVKLQLGWYILLFS